MASYNEDQTSLHNIKHIMLVLSGKGGVGKSSVTTQTALTLSALGYNVGILDIDLTGPSLPRMFGMENKVVYQSNEGWLPVSVPTAAECGSLYLMSLGFLLNNRGDSVIWKGPKKTAMIKQFINDVNWGKLDYLLIDTPPGTSDEHISIAEELRYANPDGAILVSTSQDVALADVKKEINFCRTVNLRMIGMVENMSGYVCPHCSECTDIFSSGGAKALAKSCDIPYLGKVPIDPSFVQLIENQSNEKKTLIELYKESAMHSIFKDITQRILEMGIPSRC
ncbi:HDL007Wp [Eremothecium sinecaudum]|uniref:HDL007Wp n=1 Tax=Eremothecium sinecaudum TaxID=45286 RepID=A0A0X8HSK5_9SACH|nr:HDL007Wp [Eremothecium sinecaudum]AMD20737.1 HDL007Wp [Eremothecium sinecaudum]